MGADSEVTRPLILNYHEIQPQDSAYLYSLSRQRLAAHLQVLAQAPAGRALATFDDGHRTQYENGLPVLEESGVRAVFFVTAGWTGVRATHMDWAQLRELVRLGHRVQAHGWSHRWFTVCSPAELEDELVRPKRTLEDRLGIEVESLSLPGGRYNRPALAAAAAAGYRNVFTSDPWINRKAESGVVLHGRTVVTRNLDGVSLRGMLEHNHHLGWRPWVKHHGKRALRQLFGESVYHRLWWILARHSPESGGASPDGR
jgi:peptidoglycan/xylan/chitin deacetylase (PgdA/CDA1 family)